MHPQIDLSSLVMTTSNGCNQVSEIRTEVSRDHLSIFRSYSQLLDVQVVPMHHICSRNKYCYLTLDEDISNCEFRREGIYYYTSKPEPNGESLTKCFHPIEGQYLAQENVPNIHCAIQLGQEIRI